MPKEYFEKKGNKRSGGGPFEMGSYGQGKNPIMKVLDEVTISAKKTKSTNRKLTNQEKKKFKIADASNVRINTRNGKETLVNVK